MATTVKNITIALTQEDLRIINELMHKLGESQSDVIKRAIFFYKIYTEKKR